MTPKIAPPYPASAIRFAAEYLDFERGIRVGNLEDNERITRILKLALEARYREGFVTERFGRGVYWQWIGFVSRSNRSAKTVSSKVSFGCSKFFLTIDGGLFKCGFSVERGMIRPPEDNPQIRLRPDWDWHRLLAALVPGGEMQRQLGRLVRREGFRIDAGDWENRVTFGRGAFPDMDRLRRTLAGAEPSSWAGFQVYYPMSQKEVAGSSGVDLVEAMTAVFGEVTPAMNLCMQVPLVPAA
ncbi:MAG: hypothetical protein GXY47_14610 [Acidobacteria bacterium]|nr:hypothetical protein [Acidobacteriota bacterium]